LRLVRYRLRHALFGGGMSLPLVRERLEGLRAVAALLYDPITDRVVMVEQFRTGLLEQGRGAWTLEPVGGVVAPGDEPEEAARREAIEEAGVKLSGLELIGSFYVIPGYSDDQVTFYCGFVQAESAGGIHGLAEEGEDVRVVVLDAEQAISELFSGRINTTTAIIGIQWLAKHRARLCAAASTK
jgi:ADP-ribose pyrophosphatase